MKVYRLRISLLDFRNIYRIIDVSEDCSFDELHEFIFDIFDREEEHLYSFYITKKETKSLHKIYNSPEITPLFDEPSLIYDFNAIFDTQFKQQYHSKKVKIRDIGLEEKDVFYYLFDHGDNWLHKIKVNKIYDVNTKKKFIKLIKQVGESPPQYPDFDEEY